MLDKENPLRVKTKNIQYPETSIQDEACIGNYFHRLGRDRI